MVPGSSAGCQSCGFAPTSFPWAGVPYCAAAHACDTGVPVKINQKYFALVLLGLILAIAATLRFYHLDINSVWVDEDFTYLSTTGMQFRGYLAIPANVIIEHPPQLTEPAHAKPWWTVLHPDTQDIHPPLYFFLL